MKRLITSIALLLFVGATGLSTGCTSENDQYKLTPEQTPQIPDENPRAGAAENFLPPQDG